jgi:O-glycosyl hydrolase
VDFTVLAHASNFVAPGALRIDSIASEESSLKHVAFRNSDGSIVLLALNPTGSAIALASPGKTNMPPTRFSPVL